MMSDQLTLEQTIESTLMSMGYSTPQLGPWDGWKVRRNAQELSQDRDLKSTIGFMVLWRVANHREGSRDKFIWDHAKSNAVVLHTNHLTMAVDILNYGLWEKS